MSTIIEWTDEQKRVALEAVNAASVTYHALRDRTHDEACGEGTCAICWALGTASRVLLAWHEARGVAQPEVIG